MKKYTYSAENVGERLRIYRAGLNISRDELAEGKSFSRDQLYRLETGELKSHNKAKSIVKEIAGSDHKLYERLWYGSESPTEGVDNLPEKQTEGESERSMSWYDSSRLNYQFKDSMDADEVIELYLKLKSNKDREKIARLMRSGKLDQIIKFFESLGADIFH